MVSAVKIADDELTAHTMIAQFPVTGHPQGKLLNETKTDDGLSKQVQEHPHPSIAPLAARL